ncbi:NnrS family protein [Paraburkholderia sp.]|uniref:NnrS family protein n=1 Tax=Paraburkholderia sp. TaxID=1926495 RepID=UPI0039E72508
MKPAIQIESDRVNRSPRRPPRIALWALGFRPFYLGGALFGSIAMLLWLGALAGWPLLDSASYMSGTLWHVHEMIFGFGAAIVTGFLLTAVRAWTSTNPAHGAGLAALWLLWLAGRIMMWRGAGPLGAIVDVAFLPVVALVLLRVLLRAKNLHNVFLPVALGLLALLNALFHVWATDGHGDWALRSGWLAVGMLVLFVTIIGGRIIPAFTANAVPGFSAKRWRFVEAAVIPATLLAFLLDALGAPWPAIVAACAAAAAVHGLRLGGWRSWCVGNRPILLILHIAYAGIPAGFVMLALAAPGIAPHSVAIHMFTVGVIGCAIIAMITRTARGHTGRELVAGRIELACYGLFILATLIRVLGPWLAPRFTMDWIDVSGLCWAAALILYCVRYAAWLFLARADGKPG